MLGRNTIDLPAYTPAPPSAADPTYLTPKNYPLLPFQNQQGREREPDHVAVYSLHPHSHPLRPSPNAPINRNPYINPPDQRRDPPKQTQTLTRNTSFKETMPARQSQELVRTKTESLKNGHKTSVSGSKLYNPLRPNEASNRTDYPIDLPNNYSQTVDLGSISRNQMEQSLAAPLSPEQELLKMRLQYLEVLEQQFRDFEAKKSVERLKSLQDSNRLFLIRSWEEVSKLKEERSRKTISDCVSESDNFSEDAFSVEDRSDIRNNSLRVQGEKRKFIEGFSRSREKSTEKEGEVATELKIQEKLLRELEEEFKREQSGELEKLEKNIRSLEIEIAKTNNKNEEIEAKLQNYPFFNEWKMMCTEAEGARKMDGALRKELKKRKDRLKEVKENGLPKKELSEEKRRPPIILDEQSRVRQSSLSKNRLPTMKIQATPINRSQNSSLHESSTNRQQQQPSLKLAVMGQQSRTKSVNRSSN